LRLLITGGSGFIGSHLFSKLVSGNTTFEVVNIDLNDSLIQNAQLKTVIGDLHVTNLTEIPIGGHFDYCIHIGALCKETVLENKTGLFFDYQEEKSIIYAIENFEKSGVAYDPARIRKWAQKVSKDRFKEEIKEFVFSKFNEFAGA
jgi:nucleoside-diphosphate-sugar epimerase